MTSVVGIDFGYQNSLIAAAGRGGVDVLLNGNSQRLNPYVFSLDCLNYFGNSQRSHLINRLSHTFFFSSSLSSFCVVCV